MSPELSIPQPTLFKAYEFSGLDSPVKHLLPHMKNLAARIAPTKQSVAELYCKEVTLKITNDGQWKFHYVIETKTIVLSRKSLEILWASSYAYLIYFTDVVQAKGLLTPLTDNKETKVIDLEKIPSAYGAMNLLAWAFGNWISKVDTPWPHDLAKPIRNPKSDSSENLADELTLCAVAFLLHHELAHSHLNHEPETVSFDKISQERDADYSAAEFLLSGLAPNDRFFIKKSLAIAIAVSNPIGQGIYTGYWGGNTHPRAYDRLVHVLDRFIDDKFPFHEAWIFSWSIIKLHIDGSKLANTLSVNNAPAKVDSYRHLLDLFINDLSNLPDSFADEEHLDRPSEEAEESEL